MTTDLDSASEKRGFIRSALHFASGTLLSRSFGILREMMMAIFFGTHPLLASWLVAFRSAHLLRRIVGEGGLSNGFIPYFQRLRLESEEKAARFFRDVFISLFCFLLIVVLIGEIFLWKAAPLLFGENGQMIAFLAQLMLPALIFASLYALGMAFMQCQKRYFVAAAAPILFNILWVTTILFTRKMEMQDVVVGLSIGTSLGLVAQWLVTFPATWRYLHQQLGGAFWKGICFWSGDIRALLGSMALTLVGVGAVQINSVVDLFFAKMSLPEGPAFLTYAARWMQLPLALCGVAVSSSIFPSLAKAVALKDQVKTSEHFVHGVRHTLHLLLFATLFLMTVGGSMMALFLGHGQFTLASIWSTKAALVGYAVGLIPSGFVSLLAIMFYARKEFFIPVLSSVVSIVVSFLLNLLCISYWHMGPESIAYTTSIAALINFTILFANLEVEKSAWLSIQDTLVKSLWILLTLLGCGALFAVAFPEYSSVIFESPSIYFQRGEMLFHLSRLLGFVVIYFAIVRILKISEWEEILGAVFRRKKQPLSRSDAV